jgi:4-amino-4-deoxy-L-arabinose transferase-like glycosyltransferase
MPPPEQNHTTPFTCRHLQGGYVEFPPVTALVRVLFGWSLVGFRAFAILAGAATVLVAALVARELGMSVHTAGRRTRISMHWMRGLKRSSPVVV